MPIAATDERSRLGDRRRVRVEEALDLGAAADRAGEVRALAGGDPPSRVEDQGQVEAGPRRLLGEERHGEEDEASPSHRPD